ncbi:rho GDP dissociation inhibitor [Rhodosporidiobolus nylandii]
MSGHTHEPSTVPEDDLKPTETAGYKVSERKDLDELAKLDAEDESLNKWKASLGLGAGGVGAKASGPSIECLTLSLIAPSRATPIEFDLTNPAALAITIKEGAEYSVELRFKVNNLCSGLKYIQGVRRAGITVDKLEEMCGSYGPAADPVVKRIVTEEAPSGMLARSGSYSVRSRVIDDDKNIYVDFEWSFKLAKDW